jgi:K+-transporting ATPase KdpF subunit
VLTIEGFTMPVMYIIGGVVSLGLLVYLFVALLKPEALS